MSDASDDFDINEALKDALLAAAGEGDSVRSMDSEAFLQEQLDAAQQEEDAEIAEMSPEQLFFSRHGIPALTEKVEQDKLDEELEKLVEELKNEQIEQIRNINASREADLAHRSKEMREEKNPSLKMSGIEKKRQAFARQAFDNRSNPRDDDEFGGGKKRTIRKKNMGGSKKKYYYSKKHSTRKTKSRHRSKSLRKNKYQK